jgi:hypothetical protein
MNLSDTNLPRGWFMLEATIARAFEAELASELPPVHYLKGVPVQAIAKDDRERRRAISPRS